MIKALNRIDVTLDKVSDALTSRRITRGNFQGLVSIMHTFPWWNQRKSLNLLKIIIGWNLCMMNSIISSAIMFGN